jgi:geranylgeranyl pyrophosphate synthase
MGQPPLRTKPAALRAAAAVELLHEASLIHDDIVDHSLVRRGRPSVAERFGVRTAAYLGAYMASSSVAILAEVCEAEKVVLDLDLLCLLSQAQLEEGLAQPEDSAAKRQRSLRVIQGKTGSLFKLSVQVGAALSPPGEWHEALRTMAGPFSEHLALAFQLRDDLADLENDAHIHKPGGNDLLRGLPTLPFQIWAASQPRSDAAWRRLFRCRNDRAAAGDLQQEILAAGVQDEVRVIILSELDAARTLLDPFPGDAGRNTLDSLLDQLG